LAEKKNQSRKKRNKQFSQRTLRNERDTTEILQSWHWKALSAEYETSIGTRGMGLGESALKSLVMTCNKLRAFMGEKYSRRSEISKNCDWRKKSGCLNPLGARERHGGGLCALRNCYHRDKPDKRATFKEVTERNRRKSTITTRAAAGRWKGRVNGKRKKGATRASKEGLVLKREGGHAKELRSCRRVNTYKSGGLGTQKKQGLSSFKPARRRKKVFDGGVHQNVRTLQSLRTTN